MVKKNENTESANPKNENVEIDIEALKKELYEEALKVAKEDIEKKHSKNTQSLSKNESVIKRKDTLDKNMLVPIMNVTNGKLIYQSRKTGSEYQFERYGDIEYMELYELLTMRSGQRKFLDEPFVIILDDEVTDYLGLSKLYNKLTHATEIEGIFKMPLEQFKEIVSSTPKGLAHLIVSKAKEKIKSNELDSVQKVQVIEDVFNIKLTS